MTRKSYCGQSKADTYFYFINLKILMSNKNPPYKLGLLCLIPLIGAFVGIGLIINGVFKYKNKWLVIIGLGGILFTVAAYSFLFYELRNGKESAKSFADIAQKQLNGLVQNIEFYKLEKGEYPDSLDQLQPKDMATNINDPLLVRKMDNKIDTKFHYQKIDSGYTLFSIGIDGIPKTSDDIYPNISNSGKPKIGLIK